MKERSKMNEGPKKNLRTLFRNALDEAMERNSVQHIRESYDKIINDKDVPGENGDLSATGAADGAMQEDPLRHIRETYDKRMAGDGARPKDRKDPFQGVRDSYQQIFDSKFADKPDSENRKQDGRPWWKRFF